MLRKISLAALICFSSVAMSESATAGHGCCHTGAVATAYRAPVGHSHARHHRLHHGRQAHCAPQAACCGAASQQAYRPAAADGAYPTASAYSRYGRGMGRGYGSNRAPRRSAGAYGGAYGAYQGGNPFAGSRLDLRIDGPRFGY